jgi:PA14 domain
MGAGGGGGGVNFFGLRDRRSGGLEGFFYDLKQTRDRKDSNVNNKEYTEIIQRFAKENFRESILHDYFKAPKPIYATQIMVPDMAADEGPKAFGVEKEVEPSRWVVHYKGKVSPPVSGTYHLVGGGDDVLLVRFNGKLVLDRCWYARTDWKPERNYDYGFSDIPKGFAKGDAIAVQAGQWYDLEVLIGEQPGGKVFFCLLSEKEGESYRKDSKGNPILPMFRLSSAPLPKLHKGQTFPPYQDGGPVWLSQSSSSASGSLLDALKRGQ